jgi:hypothetical protein
MFARSRAIKLAVMIAATATILSGVVTPSRAETCRVRLHIVKVGFIVGVGVGGGDGWLYCSRGRNIEPRSTSFSSGMAAIL